MPSPFPGMDPYLEHPDVFPGLHDRLTFCVGEDLQPSLPEPYYAEIRERVWVEHSTRFIGPDVTLLHPGRTFVPEPRGRGGTAVAEPLGPMPLVIRVPHDERIEPLIEIRTRDGSSDRLVTSIDVLSPTNKTPGEHGRGLYLRKQAEVLDSKVHLVEIDLLRGGEHTTAVPVEWMRVKAGVYDYHVCVHHYDNLEDYFLYPFRLEQPLPRVSIPLLPGDAPVEIELQAVFDRAYDTGPYRRRIRYREDEPVPPLTPEQAEWARGLVDAKA